MARPTVTGIDPIEFAESQGQQLMQILMWLTSALPDDERKPFIKGAAGTAIGRYIAAAAPPAPTTTKLRKKGGK